MAGLVRSGLALLLLAANASADDNRARINYLLHCQGCHLPDAIGVSDHVPRMNSFVGYFLHSTEGREFLVRVPGVSTAALPDDQLAELLNWIIETYSAEQVPDEFVPYTASEVAVLRQRPEPDPEATRQAVLREIADGLPALAADTSYNNNKR